MRRLTGAFSTSYGITDPEDKARVLGEAPAVEAEEEATEVEPEAGTEREPLSA